MRRFDIFLIAAAAVLLLIALTDDAKAMEAARTATFLANACEVAVPLVEKGNAGSTREEAAALAFCGATFMSITDMMSDMNKICLPEGETYMEIAQKFVFKHRIIMAQTTDKEKKFLDSVSFIYPVIGYMLGQYKCEKEPVREWSM